MAQEFPSFQSLRPDQLGWSCPDEWLPFQTSDEVAGEGGDVGQPGAIAALRLGVRIRARGYNIYVAGAPGTGRTSVVRRVLEQEFGGAPPPDDLCYVQNLEDPKAPRLIRLPAGKGRILKERLAGATEQFRQGLAALRASGAHRRRRERVAKPFRVRQSQLVAEFQEEVRQHGFGLVEVNLGPFRRHDLVPLFEGRPVPFEEWEGLVREGKAKEEDLERFRKTYPELAARLSASSATLRQIGQDLETALAETDSAAACPLVEEALKELHAALEIAPGERPGLDEYLEQVRQFLLAVSPAMFAAGDRVPQEGEETALPDLSEALKVNVLVDRTGKTGLPVIEEILPTPPRLLGWIEPQRHPDGSLRVDLSAIRAGSLLQADGGFLLLNARELMAEEGNWNALRRVLRIGKVAPLTGLVEGPPPLHPEPAPIGLTVILIGSPALRDALAQGDEEFTKLFKVTAQFEERVPLSREQVAAYAGFVARTTKDKKLPPFSRAAVARILEHMVRVAGGRRKLSTRFRWLGDLAQEAAWFAREDQAGLVDRAHVEEALAARREREAVMSARILESVEDGTLKLALEGRQVGQVNGLAVVETGLERFGYPMRITATSAVGRSGIIDIEREAELSGEIHTKASLILAGYLRSQFAQHHPLALTASVCFEQSYGGVEGDSASGAELAALLSALAGVPLRQDLAVTGAVDQKGNILAVGGVNEKVEGFWIVCRKRGMTGTQGVVIPVASLSSLQLEPGLAGDVAAGRFHIYAVDQVSGLMELLTGVPLGEAGPDGVWPEGSLGWRVDHRLREMAEVLRAFGGACQD